MEYVECVIYICLDIDISKTNNDISHNNNYALYQNGISNSITENNTFFNNIGTAVELYGSSGNYNDLFSDNHIIDNQGYGIYIDFANNNTVQGNFISYNTNGISDSYNSHNNYLNNTLDSNIYGVQIFGSTFIVFSNNILFNQSVGLDIENSANNNTIINNTFTLNEGYSSAGYAIFIDSSIYNTIETNNFFDNHYSTPSYPNSQIYDDTTQNTYQHNYFNDWTSPDANGDGIVDNPYNFSSLSISTLQEVYNIDPFPSVFPFNPQQHFVGNLNILSPLPNEQITFPVTLKWSELNYWNLPTTYSISYSINGGSNWYKIASGLKNTSYVWNNNSLNLTKSFTIKMTSTDSNGTARTTVENLLTITNNNPPISSSNTNTTTTTPTSTTSSITTSSSNTGASMSSSNSNSSTSASKTSPGFESLTVLGVLLSIAIIPVKRRKYR